MKSGAAGARGTSWSRQSTPMGGASWALALLLAACGTSGGRSDSGTVDTGTGDTGASDAAANMGAPSPDASTTDTVSALDAGPDFPPLTEDAATDTSAVDAPAV